MLTKQTSNLIFYLLVKKMSRTLTVPSASATATCLPLGLKAMARTVSFIFILLTGLTVKCFES